MAEEEWDDEFDDRPSKTEIKKAHLELQELADKMTGLSDGELERLGVNEDIRQAVALARKMKASGARKRQLKFCAGKMQHEDMSQIQAFLDDRRSAKVAENQKFHQLELLRDELIKKGDASVQKVMEEHPGLDRQRLRQLVREASKEAENEKPPAAARKLFKYLRENILD